MKQISNYIIEKLSLNNVEVKKETTKNYFPETEDQLTKILIDLFKERGKNANLNDIDTSKIKNMSCLFYNLKKYNNCEYAAIDISEWDVSNVTEMDEMFRDCEEFDCDLATWNVSKVESMYGMFLNCKNFEGNGLRYWELDNCRNTKSMFMNCELFNEDISNWQFRENGCDCDYMFWGCKNFNRNLESWNYKRIGKKTLMFKDCDKLKKKPSWYKKSRRD